MEPKLEALYPTILEGDKNSAEEKVCAATEAALDYSYAPDASRAVALIQTLLSKENV
jgi:hypothetical protein